MQGDDSHEWNMKTYDFGKKKKKKKKKKNQNVVLRNFTQHAKR